MSTRDRINQSGYRQRSVLFSLFLLCRAGAAGSSPYGSWSNGPSTDPNFFPIGVWLQSPQNIQEFKNIGINTFLGFWGGLDMTSLNQYGNAQMPLLAAQNSVGLTSPDRTWIKGWTQTDEPDNAQPNGNGGYGPCITPSTIISNYNSIRFNDNTRPVFLNFGRGVSDINWGGRGSCTGNTSYYPQAVQGADIISFDIYPVTNYNGQLELVSKGVDNLKTWSNNNKIIWNFVEGASMDGIHLPTPAQVKAEVWMSLIHGSQGIAYFVHQFTPTFREDGIFNYPSLVQAVTGINAQITSLAPVLNSPAVVNGAQVVANPASVPIDIMVRQYNGAIYVFAAAMRNNSTLGTFTVSGIQNRRVDVIGENRQIAMTGGQFQDNFSGYAVHLYKITNNPCDVNGDGITDVVDVQLEISQALEVIPCTADIDKNGQCSVVDIQRVINAALGGRCVSP